MTEDGIKRIRELSDKAGEVGAGDVRINYSDSPPSGRVPTIPSGAPEAVKAGLSALWSAPGKDRPRILIWLLILAAGVSVAVLLVAGILLAYLFSLGHIPAWLR